MNDLKWSRKMLELHLKIRRKKWLNLVLYYQEKNNLKRKLSCVYVKFRIKRVKIAFEDKKQKKN